MKGAYTLIITEAGPDDSFRYRAILKAPVDKAHGAGQTIASTFTETVWGARWWARKALRKHLANTRTYTFEVTP